MIERNDPAPEWGAYSALVRGTRPARYRNLFRLIYHRRCRSIVEIGVWNGAHAEQFIRVAQLRHPDVEYFGFDLFEELTDEVLREEFAKRPPSMEEVRGRLEATGASVHLFRGNTTAVLPRAVPSMPPADFVFLDGGHSKATIEADWRNVQPLLTPRSVVVLDDFYVDPPPALGEIGCQDLVASLDPARFRVKLLSPIDVFEKPEGLLKIRMVAVVPRR